MRNFVPCMLGQPVADICMEGDGEWEPCREVRVDGPDVMTRTQGSALRDTGGPNADNRTRRTSLGRPSFSFVSCSGDTSSAVNCTQVKILEKPFRSQRTLSAHPSRLEIGGLIRATFLMQCCREGTDGCEGESGKLPELCRTCKGGPGDQALAPSVAPPTLCTGLPGWTPRVSHSELTGT